MEMKMKGDSSLNTLAVDYFLMNRQWLLLDQFVIP